VILRIKNETSRTLRFYVQASGYNELPPNGYGTVTLDIIDIEVEEHKDEVQESG